MTSVSIPRVVIAAPASGQGKTTVATGLIAALRAAGHSVSPHKVGPDYIDPGYHALAADRPGRNLDPWLVGEERIAPLFRHGATTPTPADVAVVEGVMGLHDGASGRDGFASTAHVARLLGAPVILVVDASAQARTAAALVLGMRVFDPTITIAGVILNRVGSAGHEALLREAMAGIDMPVVGVLRRVDTITTPSRHLGLIPAAERSTAALATVRALGALVSRTVDLAAVMAIARGAPRLTVPAWEPAEALDSPRLTRGGIRRERVRIAVAAGAAFTFCYPETVELLEAAGAEVVTFDPLVDPTLPAGTSGVVIGGGFPEEHAGTLSANAPLRTQLADFTAPVYAECAGLVYLCRQVDGTPMCGLVPADARMTERLTLGYREATSVADTVLTRSGDLVRGHEFHRTQTTPSSGDVPAWHWDGAGHGFATGAVHASYLHTHWAGAPHLAANLVAAAAGHRHSAAAASGQPH